MNSSRLPCKQPQAKRVRDIERAYSTIKIQNKMRKRADRTEIEIEIEIRIRIEIKIAIKIEIETERVAEPEPEIEKETIIITMRMTIMRIKETSMMALKPMIGDKNLPNRANLC
jgi:hypothetical protein